MSLVVVVESDLLSRVHYVRSIMSMPGVSVISTADLQEVQRYLESATPDLICVGVQHLSGEPGWLSAVVRRTPRPKVLLVTSGSVPSTNPPRITQLADIVLRKPFTSHELVSALHGLLPEATASLAITLGEHIQLACVGAKSLRLKVSSRIGAGVVVIEQGQLWAATYCETTGLEALARALQDGNALVQLNFADNIPERRQLAGEWDMLLQQARRIALVALDDSGSKLCGSELDFSDLLATGAEAEVVRSGATITGTLSRGSHPALLRAVAAALEGRYLDALHLFEAEARQQPGNEALLRRIERLQSITMDHRNVERA